LSVAIFSSRARNETSSARRVQSKFNRCVSSLHLLRRLRAFRVYVENDALPLVLTAITFREIIRWLVSLVPLESRYANGNTARGDLAYTQIITRVVRCQTNTKTVAVSEYSRKIKRAAVYIRSPCYVPTLERTDMTRDAASSHYFLICDRDKYQYQLYVLSIENWNCYKLLNSFLIQIRM